MADWNMAFDFYRWHFIAINLSRVSLGYIFRRLSAKCPSSSTLTRTRPSLEAIPCVVLAFNHTFSFMRQAHWNSLKWIDDGKNIIESNWCFSSSSFPATAIEKCCAENTFKMENIVTVESDFSVFFSEFNRVLQSFYC